MQYTVTQTVHKMCCVQLQAKNEHEYHPYYLRLCFLERLELQHALKVIQTICFVWQQCLKRVNQVVCSGRGHL